MCFHSHLSNTDCAKNGRRWRIIFCDKAVALRRKFLSSFHQGLPLSEKCVGKIYALLRLTKWLQLSNEMMRILFTTAQTPHHIKIPSNRNQVCKCVSIAYTNIYICIQGGSTLAVLSVWLHELQNWMTQKMPHPPKYNKMNDNNNLTKKYKCTQINKNPIGNWTMILPLTLSIQTVLKRIVVVFLCC